MKTKTGWIVVLAMLLVGLCFASGSVVADSVNVIKNGSFEDEFIYGVAKYWTAFNNGGLATYTYGPDTWSKTVYDGKYSQLLSIHTRSHGGSNKDRYTGIYQTVDVVPGKRYMFTMYGMARSTEGTEKESNYNYRIEVGFDDMGGTDPWAVTEWVEMPWPEYYRPAPGYMESYAHGVETYSNKLTVFIRCWKKFPTVGQEGDWNIDAVSLVGPRPAGFEATAAAAPAQETSPALPKTGAGDLLPVMGAGLAVTAMALTGRRLFRRRT